MVIYWLEGVILMKKLLALFIAVLMSISCFSAYAANIRVFLDGNQLVFDQPPIIRNDRTLVPVRAIFEALEAEVTWDGETATVTAVKDDTTIKLVINSDIMMVNSKKVVLDSPAIIAADTGRTLVPLRAISESFKIGVSWVEELSAVYLSSGGQTLADEEGETNFEKRVLNLVNKERAKLGLAPLTWNQTLANIARTHSKDMYVHDYLDHKNSEGLNPADRVKASGVSYKKVAENIAAGQATPEEVVDGWMYSTEHKKAILDPDLKELGVGYYHTSTDYEHYWTQLFIG